jgi:NADH dehydrogenase/NADH:ubiquinone oxidoreductase subunit G
MKLSDIEKTNSTTMNKKMHEKLGWNLNLNAMTVESAVKMMESIDKKLSGVRSSHKLHESQKNPNYVGMLMAKQILESYVTEAKLSVSDNAKPDYIDIDGDGDKKEPMKKAAKDKTAKKIGEAAKSTAQQQAAGAALAAKRGEGKAKGASKEMMGMSKKELEKYAGTKHKGLPKHVSESRRRLNEDELGQAQAMLAAKDMVDSMQDMIEDLSKMLNEQLPPLTDSIRTAIGSAEADSFKAAASSTLSSLLTSVQSSREAMDQAVRTLSGEPGAVTVPGSDMGAPDLGGDEMDLPDAEDDFAASDAAVGGDLPLGREKR